MSYCTIQDMINRFGEDELIQLTDRDGVGVLDRSSIQQAIDDACAIMDSYIGARYAVPLADPVPGDVSVYAADLARCQLYDSDTIDKAEERCERVMRWLRDVAAGRAVLPGVEPLSEGAAGAVAGGTRRLTFTDAYFGRMPGGSE